MGETKEIYKRRTAKDSTNTIAMSRLRRFLAAPIFLCLQVFPLLAQQSPGPGIELFRKLRSVGLDSAQTFRVRDASLDREDIHISLNDGTISFTEAVDGRITGAFFVGEGELLLVPPDQGERASLALFTNSAVLEEKFSSAYFRFADAKFLKDLEPSFRDEPNRESFVAKWNPAAKNLSDGDAVRLLIASSNEPKPDQSFIHARLSGASLGTFDVMFDTLAPEQISAGQASFTQQGSFYDVWTQFPMRSRRTGRDSSATSWSLSFLNPVEVKKFTIKSTISPPTDLAAEATLELETSQSGIRAVVFELSRFLKLSSVAVDGIPVEFIQNEAVPGSELARKGNDLIAMVLPHALPLKKTVIVRFQYSGPVLSDAGNGLLRVGARGNWYPNLGFMMSNFDLEFHYPDSWTLLATGKLILQRTQGSEQITRWSAPEPIPVAGFNLGHYNSVSSRAANAEIATYAAKDFESTFAGRAVTELPSAPQVIFPGAARRGQPSGQAPFPLLPDRLVPSLQKVAEQATRTLDFLVPKLGPFPFPNLELTQIPGGSSQGWPGLVFLSSYTFIDPQKIEMKQDVYQRMFYDRIMVPHEIAHQWWGDAVSWGSYRDQWISESFANYCALLLLEKDRPADFRLALNKYARDLLEEHKSGKRTADAGPVTQGMRLASSRIPGGYDTIVYGRGTWLVHMLRTMFRDAGMPGSKTSATVDPDARFFSVLESIQRKYSRHQMTTRDLQKEFEHALPKDLYWEGTPSLTWFFEGWVNGTAVPSYQLNELRLVRRGAKTIAAATLVQKDAPKDLITSVPIYAVGPSGKPEFVGRVFADGSETDISLAVPAATTKLLIDPSETILSRR